MVSAVNNSNASLNAGIQKTSKTPNVKTDETGASQIRTPPGQAAKEAIESSNRADLPANIQGKVASALARGLPIDGLLKLQEAASADETAEAPADDPVVEDAELIDDAANETDATIELQDEVSTLATVTAENDASIAAALLEAAPVEEDGTSE